jgi:hypothetical protein
VDEVNLNIEKPQLILAEERIEREKNHYFAILMKYSIQWSSLDGK